MIPAKYFGPICLNIGLKMGLQNVFVYIYIYIYTGVGKSRFYCCSYGNRLKVMIITVTLLTQKNVTMAQCTLVQSCKFSNCRPSSLFTHVIQA